jgi:hypothetical protein
LVQTEDDFQSILKIFENNQKIILTEIKNYLIRLEQNQEQGQGQALTN